MTHPPITLIAYGSLMSGLGLAGLGHLPVTRAEPVRVRNVRRGFGKLSQYGDRYAMVLEPLRLREPIVADGASANADGLDALALTMSLSDFSRVAVREGYQAAAVFALMDRAIAAHAALPEHLWQMLVAADFDVARYRRSLFDAIGYTSPHYVPHPVEMAGARPALTFLAPGSEGSGSDSVVPVRVRTAMTDVLSLTAAWRLKPNDSQLDYFAMCLLAEVHNMSLRDVRDGLDDELHALLRTRLASELMLEPQRFRAALGLDADVYAAQFLSGASARSCLDK
ncbi:MAG TPA: hypothetical protein VL403_19200 [Candidatus Kryptonia bacterium]|nr:hypothetical protein [Candidatus Kryptonia bacterium]